MKVKTETLHGQTVQVTVCPQGGRQFSDTSRYQLHELTGTTGRLASKLSQLRFGRYPRKKRRCVGSEKAQISTTKPSGIQLPKVMQNGRYQQDWLNSRHGDASLLPGPEKPGTPTPPSGSVSKQRVR